MASPLHDTLVGLFVHRPRLAADLLAGALGVRVPEHDGVRLEEGQIADLVSTEYRADAVTVLEGSAGPRLAIIVEVQLRRDADKRWSWPVYLATLRARSRCPAVLLVVCVDEPVARWCRTPIETGHPGWTLTPLVLGPSQIPVVDSVTAAARDPELAVLSALAHGSDPDRRPVLDALVGGLSQVEKGLALLYADIVLDALSEAARRHLEELMATGTYEYQSDFARRYYSEGVTDGLTEGLIKGRAVATAHSVLRILEVRGVPVSAAVRSRVMATGDEAEMDRWLARAVVVPAAEDLFDEPAGG